MSAETLELDAARHGIALHHMIMKHLAKIAKWTHWDLNPGPSACEADVIPLHHVPSKSEQAFKHTRRRWITRAWRLRPPQRARAGLRANARARLPSR